MVVEGVPTLQDSTPGSIDHRAPAARRKRVAGFDAGQFEADARSGNEIGVRGTPTFFINGVRHTGDYDLDTLLTALTTKAAA
jgi:hypothetical protein